MEKQFFVNYRFFKQKNEDGYTCTTRENKSFGPFSSYAAAELWLITKFIPRIEKHYEDVIVKENYSTDDYNIKSKNANWTIYITKCDNRLEFL